MAELVDALGSGPSGSNTVQVRVLFWAFSVMDTTLCNIKSCILVSLRNGTQKGTQTPRKGMKNPCTIADAGWKTRMKMSDGYWAPSGICTQRLLEALQCKCVVPPCLICILEGHAVLHYVGERGRSVYQLHRLRSLLRNRLKYWVLHGKLGDCETGIEGEHPAFGLLRLMWLLRRSWRLRRLWMVERKEVLYPKPPPSAFSI